MDRDRIREEVRQALDRRLQPAPLDRRLQPAPLDRRLQPAPLDRRLQPASSPAASKPVDVVSWRRFDDPQVARRALITEADVMRARGGDKVLAVPADAIVTPLARETAGRLGVRLESGGPATGAAPLRAVAIAADHGGFALKEALKSFVAGLGFEVTDFGTKDTNPVDYPDFAHQVAVAVTGGRATFGIVIDGVGVGSAMAANRHRGARAAPCSTTVQAHSAREHNDANVLTLGGRHLGEDVAKAIAKEFLETPFAGGRHLPRVEKIEVSR